MITASIVLYHTNEEDINRILNCVSESSIDLLFLVDNSLTDRLKHFANNSNKIIYIFNNKNLGYGAAHNIAINKSIHLNAKYHVVLNPDVYFHSKIIRELECYMDINHSCGLVMPRILYPNGDNQYLCKLLPTPIDLFVRRFIPKKYTRKREYKYELRFMNNDKITSIPSLSGCFMFMRVDILKKVCGFDERFFMYAEDLDLCRRIGMVSDTIFNPHISIYHEYEKGSYSNIKLLRFHIISIVKYFNKWGWFFDNDRKSRNNDTLKRLGF